jgi:dTDP-L-rhamnose 4-epimerase
LAQEHILQAWCSATETQLSVLRLQNVYGPGQSVSNSYTGVLTYFARLATAREEINVFEDGLIVRDFVYIDDVARALAAAIDEPPEHVRVVDIGSGQASTILEVARAIARHEGAPDPRVSGDFREGDVRAASCSIEEARRQLGYEPTVMVEGGVSGLLEWVKAFTT